MMVEQVKARLASLGYAATSADDYLINFLICKVENYIKDNCNIEDIPEGLIPAEIDLVCGYFLSEKKAVNPDSLAVFDFSPTIKQISEGDTSITYDGAVSSDSRLDSLIDYLTENGKKELTKYRRLAW